MIKLSEFEKSEQDRLKRQERKSKDRHRSKERTPEQDKNHKKEVDYNALDYEDANQSEEEQETAKKVSSLVQYPVNVTSNGAQKQDGNETDLVLNKRSDVLALALGVQVKTGEDPPDGEIRISGYDKPSKIIEKVKNNSFVHFVLF